MTLETENLDSYPEHKAMFEALIKEAPTHPFNLHILWYAISHLVEITGDDDLFFELQEIYEKLENTKKVIKK